MAKKHYDEVNVIRALDRKSGISINYGTRSILVDKEATDVGNGSWGKIDYLCNYCGYTYLMVSKLPRKGKPLSVEIEENNANEIVGGKTLRKAKINMANMTKNVMKKIALKR